MWLAGASAGRRLQVVPTPAVELRDLVPHRIDFFAERLPGAFLVGVVLDMPLNRRNDVFGLRRQLLDLERRIFSGGNTWDARQGVDEIANQLSKRTAGARAGVGHDIMRGGRSSFQEIR